MKFILPPNRGYNNQTSVESVYEHNSTLMGYTGKVYYCLSDKDPDIYDVLKRRILESKYPIDMIKYAEGVVIETDGRWIVIKSRYGATTNAVDGEVTVFPVGYVHPVRTTKAFLFEVMVIDFENMGVDEIRLLLKQNRFIYPRIISSKMADIGEWTDEHPLNKTSKTREDVMKYFETSNV